ncbi:MAG TPA: hypothetical protein VHE79_07050 [Spirochaetia bacterium]
MCDTLYVPARSDGISYFAKNSDRHPEEPQVAEIVGSGGGACLLSRPVWMRGAEMGVNARGVVIGNEAVFARRKADPAGVLGMDILRGALESCGTAEEAVEHIARAVETTSQGGNGAYRGKLVYDNSYLVADWSGAWVIETAGHRWAARRATGPAAISNSYSLTDDFDRADPATTAARRSGFSWKASVESRLYRVITQGDTRRSCSLAAMAGMRGGAGEVMQAMRSHGDYDLARPHVRNMRSVCMHGGGLVNNATTASMVVALDARRRAAVIWLTVSPAPCLSLYRPVLLEDGAFVPLWTDYDWREGSDAALDHWRNRRAVTTRLERTVHRDPSFAARRDAAQTEVLDAVCRRAGDAAACIGTVNRVVADFEGA